MKVYRLQFIERKRCNIALQSIHTSFIPPPPLNKSSNGLPNPAPPNGPPGPPPEAACSNASGPTCHDAHKNILSITLNAG